MSEHDAKGAAREEAARQGVYIVMTALAIPVLIWIQRKSSEPDTWRTVKMRAARQGERAAASMAAYSWRAAEWCRRAYDGLAA